MENNNKISWIKSRWTMSKIGISFYDSIGNKVINQWQDCYGDVWLAESRWGFRVKTNHNEKYETIPRRKSNMLTK